MGASGQEIRKSFGADAMKRRQRETPLGAAFVILAHIALGASAAWASFAAVGASAMISVPAYLVAAFFIGTRFRALSNLMHECSHYSLTTDRDWNNRFGRLLSIPLMTSFDRFRSTHFSHHQHTGDSALDLDFLGYEKFRFDEPLTRSAIVRHLWVTLTLRHVPSFVGRTFYAPSDPLLYKAIRIAFLGGIVASLVIAGPLSTPALVVTGYLIIPYATTFQIINYWTDVIDHAGLFDNADDLHKTRNAVVENPVLRAVLFPRQDCFHLVHHLFPLVPAAQLPAFHEELMGSPTYAALDHGLLHRILSKPSSTLPHMQTTKEPENA